jgi:internalin A
MIGTLSLVLPVAASAAKLALDEAIYKGLENQLDFGKKCSEAMSDAVKETEGWIARKDDPDAKWLSEKNGITVDLAGTIRAHGGILRGFQMWLKEKDPNFGGLVRVQNKQHEFLWVHRDFEKEY